MAETADVVVVGGGVIGTSIAWSPHPYAPRPDHVEPAR
jgi:L-2-hydroxyglutarate oxidase LhgO